MFQLVIKTKSGAWKPLEIDSDSVALSFEMGGIGDLFARYAPSTYTIKAPRTLHNDRVLGYPNISQLYQHSATSYECELLRNGQRVIDQPTRLYVLSTERDYHNVQVVGTAKSLTDLLDTIKFGDDVADGLGEVVIPPTADVINEDDRVHYYPFYDPTHVENTTLYQPTCSADTRTVNIQYTLPTGGGVVSAQLYSLRYPQIDADKLFTALLRKVGYEWGGVKYKSGTIRHTWALVPGRRAYSPQPYVWQNGGKSADILTGLAVGQTNYRTYVRVVNTQKLALPYDVGNKYGGYSDINRVITFAWHFGLTTYMSNGAEVSVDSIIGGVNTFLQLGSGRSVTTYPTQNDTYNGVGNIAKGMLSAIHAYVSNKDNWAPYTDDDGNTLHRVQVWLTQGGDVYASTEADYHECAFVYGANAPIVLNNFWGAFTIAKETSADSSFDMNVGAYYIALDVPKEAMLFGELGGMIFPSHIADGVTTYNNLHGTLSGGIGTYTGGAVVHLQRVISYGTARDLLTDYMATLNAFPIIEGNKLTLSAEEKPAIRRSLVMQITKRDYELPSNYNEESYIASQPSKGYELYGVRKVNTAGRGNHAWLARGKATEGASALHIDNINNVTTADGLLATLGSVALTAAPTNEELLPPTEDAIDNAAVIPYTMNGDDLGACGWYVIENTQVSRSFVNIYDGSTARPFGYNYGTFSRIYRNYCKVSGTAFVTDPNTLLGSEVYVSTKLHRHVYIIAIDKWTSPDTPCEVTGLVCW